MAKKGRKSTKAEREAGARNLAKWREQNPERAKTAALRHGGWSKHIRERYSDGRTVEGKRLKVVVDSIAQDLGGPGELTAGQKVVLGFLRSKLIVIWQISAYMDRQISVLDSKGDLLACLSKSYLTYLDSAARDLERLYGLNRSKKGKIPSLQEIIKGHVGAS